MTVTKKLPITVIIAVRNEEANLGKCLVALGSAERIVVVDSGSTDQTVAIAEQNGAEVFQFEYKNSYPKKRQWVMDTVDIKTPWIFLLDADEVITEALWAEVSEELAKPQSKTAYMITKAFHFLGKRLRWGGFSHSAVMLFRTGSSRFEELVVDPTSNLDMEVHERLVVNGSVGTLTEPVMHEDFKGLQAYIDRHNRYSSWEAELRYRFLSTGLYGGVALSPKLFGNAQERRRFLKKIVMRLPFEHWVWFVYHYLLRLGFLEGRRGLIACQIRAAYIAQTNAKIYELELLGCSR